MADRELTITLRFAQQAAEQAARQWHQQENARIRETASEQEKADKAFVRAMKLRARALEALAREFERRFKEQEKAQEKANRATLAGFRKLQDEMLAAATRRAQEEARRIAAIRDRSISNIRAKFKQEDDAYAASLRHQTSMLAREYQHRAQMARQQAETLERFERDRRSRMEKLNKGLIDNIIKGNKEDDAESKASKTREFYRDQMEGARKFAEQYSELAKESSAKYVAYKKQAHEASVAMAKAETREAKVQAEARMKTAERHAVEHKNLAKTQADWSRKYAEDTANHAKRASRGQSDLAKETATKIARSADDAARSAEKSLTRADSEVVKSSRKATGEVKKALKGVGDEADSAAGKTRNLAQAFVMMHLFDKIANMMEHGMRAVGQSAADAQKYVEGLVNKMEAMRDRTAEILAMRGQQATGMATAGLAREAAEASVKTEDYLKFTEELQANIQQHVGEGPQFRLSQEQSEQLAKESVTYAVSKGVTPGAAAQLLGTAIEKAPTGRNGKVDTNTVRDKFAKLVGTMQESKGRTSPLMPQFAEVASEMVGEGADFNDILEAAVLFRVGTQINPKHASAYTRAITRGLRQIRQKEELADELGITKQMTTEQALEQAAKRIPEIAKQEGISENEATSKYFNEIREFAGFRAYINQGVRGGLFKRVRAQQAAAGASDMEKGNAAYMASERGVRNRQSAEKDRAELERGARYNNLMVFRNEAANRVIEQGELEGAESLIPAVLTASGQQFGLGNRAESETLANEAANMATLLGNYKEGQEFLAGEGRVLETDPRGINLQVRKKAADLLTRLRRDGDRATAISIQEGARREAFRRDAARMKGRGFSSYEQFKGAASYHQMSALDVQANKVLREKGATAPNPNMTSRLPNYADRMEDVRNAAADTHNVIADAAKDVATFLSGGRFHFAKSGTNAYSRKENHGQPITRPMTPREAGAQMSQELLNKGLHSVNPTDYLPPAPRGTQGHGLHSVNADGEGRLFDFRTDVSRVPSGQISPVGEGRLFDFRTDVSGVAPGRKILVGEAAKADAARRARFVKNVQDAERHRIAVERNKIVRNARRHGMHKSDSGTDWFVDEHGHLRHHAHSYHGVSLEDARNMPVTWKVKPNNRSMYAPGRKDMEDGMHGAAKDLKEAAKAFKPQLPPALPAAPPVRRS